ncbi:dTDP-4-amino-4,6-dideoxygalactose transaminase [Luteimonas sp. MJ204]|uniref:dTDP-4-amino-4,6-dideoxygalactose transaminase n=1 Tax=Luteimonas sp. MJ145 TaxID=3129234 RepID=UPI0031BB5607
MIPFNRPCMTGDELANIAAAHSAGHLSGDGAFTRRCHAWLERETGAARALLTHSCTAALEMSALLADVGPGDEVIMPSYTFVSTANAFALRGATPVFVDVREDTLNLDETLVEAAVTARTRAICVVHYAGVACEMDAILDIAARHGLLVVEDAAQALMSRYRGRPLGSLGALGTFSFHETKNVMCGEGGALLVNDPALAGRAEIIREKGTNRGRFRRGEVDKYTWCGLGSSYLPGEVTAAFLAAQLDHARELTDGRLALWRRYHDWADSHERAGRVRRPVVPEHCEHNAHMYYLLAPDAAARGRILESLRADGVLSVFHYVPLHSSPAGARLGRAHGGLEVTDDIAARLFRLPMWIGLDPHMDHVLEAADRALRMLG